MSERYEEQGGEPPCLLNQVCEECGKVRTDLPQARCEHCGHVPDEPEGERPAPKRRDRDAEGRARNARPRDGLGRPLPYGTPGVERQPEGVVRTPDETLAEAQRLLDRGRPFHAHEVFEDAWKSAPEAETGLWKGLAQMAVGITHLARGNAKGGARLLLRGASGIEPYREGTPHGIDVGGLVDWARHSADEVEQGRGPDGEPPASPRLR